MFANRRAAADQNSVGLGTGRKAATYPEIFAAPTLLLCPGCLEEFHHALIAALACFDRPNDPRRCPVPHLPENAARPPRKAKQVTKSATARSHDLLPLGSRGENLNVKDAPSSEGGDGGVAD